MSADIKTTLKKDVKPKKVAYIIGYSPSDLKEIIESAETNIGAVTFRKRTNGEVRRMTYRLHVKDPKFAKKPTGQGKIVSDSNLITVFDTNKVIRDANNVIIGRGAWRTIPLDSIMSITAAGKKYIVSDYKDSSKILNSFGNID